MKVFVYSLAVFAISIFICVGQGSAGIDPQCKDDVKAEFRSCKSDCKTEYRTDKDLCRNVDPVCGTACRAIRAACIEPFEEAVDACKDVCRGTLADAKVVCKLIEDAEARDLCIDAAQITAFICKDDCREDTTVDDPNTPEVDPIPWREGLKACRQISRACIKACPPPPAAP